MANDNDNAAGRDLLRVMGRLMAHDAIVRMIAGNAFAGQAEDHAREWAAEVVRYLGTLEPERDLAPDELLSWVAVKTEAMASGTRLLKGALEVAARIRADRDQD